jgi:N6-adenosine-specific RNA methylase IME4
MTPREEQDRHEKMSATLGRLESIAARAQWDGWASLQGYLDQFDQALADAKAQFQAFIAARADEETS